MTKSTKPECILVLSLLVTKRKRVADVQTKDPLYNEANEWRHCGLWPFGNDIYFNLAIGSKRLCQLLADILKLTMYC